MLHSMISAFLVLSAGSFEEECVNERRSVDYHLADVCDPAFGDGPVYSATFAASLTPPPASQQVVIYRLEGEWFVRIAGFRWKAGEVVTRRLERPIADSDAAEISERITGAALRRLGALPYYGADDAICSDGASLTLETARNGKRISASQHSCAGKTELNDLADAFRSLALKYDPESSGLLSGLSN
ncbi:hypothetical protein V5F89_05075 [Pelagerythrobacter marensis]|uniref:Uncharacterized protein n=1 Tax=Pelagerythrobacter marensis TaxID=543877 RepID=A0ABZ2D5M0_9SPHN